jgi:hypothetical protein
LLAQQQKKIEQAEQSISPRRQPLGPPYVSVPMGLASTSDDWGRKNVPNWCNGREIVVDNGKQPFKQNDYVDSGIEPQRQVKLDKTYAREDIDLTRSLRRNAAAAAAAAIKDGNIITQLSVHHIYDLLR